MCCNGQKYSRVQKRRIRHARREKKEKKSQQITEGETVYFLRSAQCDPIRHLQAQRLLLTRPSLAAISAARHVLSRQNRAGGGGGGGVNVPRFHFWEEKEEDEALICAHLRTILGCV